MVNTAGHLILLTLAAYNGCTSFLIVPELPDGNMFSGQVSLNQAFTPEMADPDSTEFQLVASNFSNFVSFLLSFLLIACNTALIRLLWQLLQLTGV